MAAAAVAYGRARRGDLLQRRMEATAFEDVCIRGRILTDQSIIRALLTMLKQNDYTYL